MRFLTSTQYIVHHTLKLVTVYYKVKTSENVGETRVGEQIDMMSVIL